VLKSSIGGPLKNLMVFVVDDDPAVCRSIALMAQAMGMKSSTFSSAESFLENAPSQPNGCLVTDIRMLGMSGVELLEETVARGWKLPAIVVTAHADVRLALQVVRAGAMTLLEKPYQEQELWDAMSEALKASNSLIASLEYQSNFRRCLSSLTPDELVVLREMLEGVPNKVASRELDIAPRTLDLRRKSVLKKMSARCAIHILRMFLEADVSPDEIFSASSVNS
jgi:two-component system response regulator FixJ